MTGPLGKQVAQSDVFDPGILYPIARAPARAQIGMKEGRVPFEGIDIWTCYELSWLSMEGLPQVGIGLISYPSDSPSLVESKSLKLFLGSMNFTRYPGVAAVEDTIRTHLSALLNSGGVLVRVLTPPEWGQMNFTGLHGESVDTQSLADGYPVRIQAGDSVVEETLHSHLLRSLCPVTSQPDWGSVLIRYKGRKLDRLSLLGYLIAHRSYQGYHEECCERIFVDILTTCSPEELWVGCFYTRRGGIDINPMRWLPGSTAPTSSGFPARLARQ
jgi:7-cyano-7-deazaguanine reductase